MNKRVLPGFGLSLGFTLVYLSLLILLPLSGLLFKASSLNLGQFWDIATGERALASYRVTFGASALAAAINAVFGLIVAWMLVRYPFPGKRFVDALVDLPFALPTAVAGITLATLYASNGWIGRHLEPLGLKVAFTPVGIVVALTFIGRSFVVRTLQPAIEDIVPQVELAAAPLGGSLLQTSRRGVLAGNLSCVADRLHAGVFSCGRRVRFGHLHRRQHAARFREHALADHLQARTVRCGRSDGAGLRDAHYFVRSPARR